MVDQSIAETLTIIMVTVASLANKHSMECINQRTQFIINYVQYIELTPLFYLFLSLLDHHYKYISIQFCSAYDLPEPTRSWMAHIMIHIS